MTQSTLYAFNILGIPAMYWIILVVSHAIHVYFRIEADIKSNPAALKEFMSDTFKQIGLVIGLAQSMILLVVGWDAYTSYLATHPDLDISLYIGIGIAFIGYGGSSIWTNLMDIIKNKITKKISD